MIRLFRYSLLFFALWFGMSSTGLLWAHNNLDALKFSGQAPEKPYEVYLLAGTLQPEAGLNAIDRQLLAGQSEAARASGQGKIHALVQLTYIPDQQQEQALRSLGIELLEYIPNYTWVAAIPAENPAGVLDAPLVRWLGSWSAADKLHPYIREAAWNSYAIHPTEDKVMVMVLLHRDVPLERGAALAETHGGVALPSIAGVHGLTMWLPKTSLLGLAAEEEVAWIEEGEAPLSPNNDGARSDMHVDALYSAPYNLTGAGVRLFVFDGGTVMDTHTTFDPGTGSRVTIIDGGSVSNHPTHVAGTAAGDGNGTRAQGVAPGASILSAEYEQIFGSMLFWDNSGDIEADYDLARNSYNADLGTNSIGSNTASNGYDCAREGDYGVSSNMLDGIVRGDNITVGSPVIMTWANGNERGGGTSYPGRCGSNFLTTAPPSCAKNPIHIGAINSNNDTMTDFSSWGPCDDGRMKPVVVAPGCEMARPGTEGFIYSSLSTGINDFGGSGWCGTSMATPAAAGVVSLMLEQWRDLGYGGANDRPLPALVKALLIHSSRDLGVLGPDYIYGYGAVDAKAVIDLIRSGHPLAGPGAERWGTDSITHGANDTFTFTLPPDVAELKASLAWDDAAAAAYSAIALVNDLDLELVAPDNVTIHRAWTLNPAAPNTAAARGTNTRDNQEQVLVTNPAAGTWTIRVKGTTVPSGPQSYGLVISANYPTYDAATCTQQITNQTFETNTTGWTLSGAARVAAPAAGHGGFSLRLGGVNSAVHTAYTTVSIPSGAARAELNFYWYMTTNETPGHGYDNFYAEVRDTSGNVLQVKDFRSDGWTPSLWLKAENLDLTAWAGQTVRIYFYSATDSSLSTTFYVDDVSLQTCLAYTKNWWVGRTNAWNASSNWSEAELPGCATDATIPNPPLGGIYPTVNADVDVRNLTVKSGAQLNMSTNTLGVCGNWTLESGAALNASGGTVMFKGGVPQSIGGAASTAFYNLSILNASGANLALPASASGVEIQGGGLFSLAGNLLQVSGHWINHGTFSPAGGEVEFIGATWQMVGGLATTSFDNLKINSPGGVDLTQATTVNNLLTLSNGLLRLNDSNLLLGASATVGGSPSAGAMVVTNGSGELRKAFNATGLFTFPVGDNIGTTQYSPATLNFTSGSFAPGAYAAVRVGGQKFGGNLAATDFLARYWDVDQNGITSFACSTTFNYLDADIVGSEANIQGGRMDGAVWTLLGLVNSGANTFGANVSSFTIFTGLPAGVVSYPMFFPGLYRMP